MSDLASETTAVQPWLYWSLLPIHRAVLKAYFRSITITGREYLPAKGPLVIASKHYSRWDPLILSLLSAEPFRYMTDVKQFQGVQGWFIKRLGAFPVDRTRPSISSFRSAISLLHHDHQLVIFPEGGIVRDQPLRTFKTGLARLVLQAETASPEKLTVPIVPIALHYSPDSSARAKVFIRVCPMLHSQNHQHATEKQTAQSLTNALHHSILEGLKEIEAQLKQGAVV